MQDCAITRPQATENRANINPLYDSETRGLQQLLKSRHRRNGRRILQIKETTDCFSNFEKENKLALLDAELSFFVDFQIWKQLRIEIDKLAVKIFQCVHIC